MPTTTSTRTADQPARPRLTVRVTVNPVDPAAARAFAAEDRAYWADRYDTADTDED
ncbi:hypothetical protein RM572_00585 [Streptomyces sp. DSM 42041]|uniref:GNAT family N-acetyltransferase n=1 Tax=Streptomyces hazeniae TaxID=3075538 RepID=A0ABU2NLC3_9ACTN|nr:hypothetical protein [Streptomyces sp. DSM 42041]MDT0377272.1 hypothetical protein [Streptomyces sp. DSM 42041]